MDIPKLSLENLENKNMCFGCGKENAYGFKLNFSQDAAGAVISEFIPGEHHQGWPGYVHGGALMVVIDEAIGWASHFANFRAGTAKIEFRLRSMALIGEPLTIRAWITRQTSRTLEVSAQVKRSDETIVAEASSVQFIAR